MKVIARYFKEVLWVLKIGVIALGPPIAVGILIGWLTFPGLGGVTGIIAALIHIIALFSMESP